MLALATLLAALVAQPLGHPLSATPAAISADTLPTGFFLAEKPADAKDLRDAKTEARKGERIVFFARVGGRSAPFVKDRAILVAIDNRLRSCDEIPGDTCPKPWDYCCEPKDSLRANLATVQVVGGDGKPLKVGLEAAGGLQPLARITVVGTVAEKGSDGTLVVNAEGIHVSPPPKR